MKRLLLAAGVLALCTQTPSYAQLGKLKDLKNKVGKNKDKSGSTNTGGPKVGKSEYDKQMDAGAAAEGEKDWITAAKSYRAALASKSGDYSAKSKLGQMEGNIKDEYFSKIENKAKEGKCDEAQADLDKAMDGLDNFWGQENWLKKKIAECKEKANAPKISNGIDPNSIAAGKGAFYEGWKGEQPKSSVNCGVDLFVRMKFDKTMSQAAQSYGGSGSGFQYAYVNYYFDGKLVNVIPISFDSRFTAFDYMDLPLLISKDVTEGLQKNPSALQGQRDIWMLQQFSADNGTNKQFTMNAIQNLTGSSHKVKIEFGVGEKGAKAPKVIISTAEATITCDAEGKKKLYKKGPKWMQPLEPDEAGTITFSSQNFSVGNGELSVKIDLPKTPKYYNMKWCQPFTCDYDHGQLGFYAELDGEYLDAWNTVFSPEDYDVTKSYNFIAIPANDVGLFSSFKGFNDSKIFPKDQNYCAYPLLDKIYGNQLKDGTHKLSIMVYSPEAIKLGTSFEKKAESYKNVKYIAKQEVTFTSTSAGRSKMKASTIFKGLKHKGGQWTAVEAHVKKTTEENMTIKDIAVTSSEWEVTKNVYGVIQYRMCTADLVYKCKYGTRVTSIRIKEKHNGTGYGKPYITTSLFALGDTSPFSLGPGVAPVPTK